MRYPEDMARGRGSGEGKRSGRGRVIAIVVVVVLVALILSLRAIAGFFTDYLWFQAAGAESVWSTQIKVKVGLAAGFTLAFFALLWVNLVLVDRLAPRHRTLGPDEEFLQRYDDLIRPRQRLVRLAIAVLFALIAGVEPQASGPTTCCSGTAAPSVSATRCTARTSASTSSACRSSPTSSAGSSRRSSSW